MYKPSPQVQAGIKPALWGAAAGVVATIVVGFGWGGWVTGGSAKALAAKQVESAQIAILAPLCAQKFASQPDAAVKRVAIGKLDSWKQSDELQKDWVTLPGASYQNSDLADACLKLVLKQPVAAAK